MIGLVKNAGKTTVVNALMDNVPLRFGLTSLGLDGERTDNLTGLAKPRIVPPRGTLIATTVGSLDRSHYTMEHLERLPFHTSLGGVVIGRAVGDRAVEISGPTTLTEVAATAARLHAHGARLVLVDGAINRLGSASPRVSDAVIMATGGLVADTLDETVETTLATLEMLTLPEVDPQTRGLVTADGALRARVRSPSTTGAGASTLDLATVVGEGVRVAREVERRQATVLFVGGALTQEFADDFLRTLPPLRKVTVVVRDATVLILTAGDGGPVPPSRHRPARAHAAARPGRDRQPLPLPTAVQARGLLRRGRRRSRRPRPCLRRRPRPGCTCRPAPPRGGSTASIPSTPRTV